MTEVYAACLFQLVNTIHNTHRYLLHNAIEKRLPPPLSAKIIKGGLHFSTDITKSFYSFNLFYVGDDHRCAPQANGVDTFDIAAWDTCSIGYANPRIEPHKGLPYFPNPTNSPPSHPIPRVYYEPLHRVMQKLFVRPALDCSIHLVFNLVVPSFNDITGH